MIILLSLTLLAWIWLAAAHGQFWRSEPVLPAARPGPALPVAVPVAVIVPARDEAAHVEASLRSLLAQDYPGSFRVILVDDGSTDGTGALAARIEDPRLRVLQGAPRPADWSGKLWAVAQGVAETDEPLLLLTDADILHAPGHLSTLVAQAEREGLALVSEMAALRCKSLAERALIPAFVYFFQWLYPFSIVNDPAEIGTAAAAGGVILLRRTALTRIGGIESIRTALIDDVALAQAVKRVGRIWLGHSEGAQSVRAYPTVVDIERMIARTAYVQIRHSPLLLAGAMAAMSLLWLLPPLAVLFGHGQSVWLGLFCWIISSATYWPSVRRYRQSPLWLPCFPLVALFYMVATIHAALNYHRGRGVMWKGRAYAGV